MRLGIFAKTFARASVDATLEAVARAGVRVVQFNFACCGLPTLPPVIAPAVLAEVVRSLAAHDLSVAAVSGTFNLIHPDPVRRRADLVRLPVLAAAAQALGSPMITLCTGTRNPEDMWRGHPENTSASAWRDLRSGLDEALAVTEPWGTVLGIEPEHANVVTDARSAERLLTEVATPRVRIVFDPANLLGPADRSPERRRVVIDDALARLGPALGLAHAKELSSELIPDNRGAGRGIIDWSHYLSGLSQTGFAGSVILHGLAESEVSGAVACLRGLGVAA